MWDIWASLLLPKAVNSCLKYNKSPNLVTLASRTRILGYLPKRKTRFQWCNFFNFWP